MKNANRAAILQKLADPEDRVGSVRHYRMVVDYPFIVFRGKIRRIAR